MKKEEATGKKEEPTKKKEEPTKKKEGAKEEGAAPKHIRVAYADKSRNIRIYVLYGLAVLLVTVVLAFVIGLLATRSRVPRFVLEDLYVDDDHLSNSRAINPSLKNENNSRVMVKLSSTNPNHKASVYYRNMNLHVRIREIFDFETESVSLESKLQEPGEVTTWTAVVANNNDNNVRPTGAFMVRHGNGVGDVIAEMKIQWKSGIFKSSKLGLRVTCPVLVRLKDLSSAVPKPNSACSHHHT